MKIVKVCVLPFGVTVGFVSAKAKGVGVATALPTADPNAKIEAFSGVIFAV